MFCTHCGAKLEDGVRVCPVCHTEVEFFEEVFGIRLNIRRKKG